jgi:sialate O-acetylesterase
LETESSNVNRERKKQPKRAELVVALCATLMLGLACPATGDVRLPRLVSDGMVLQRDAPVRIWGWATPGERVTVHFLDRDHMTASDEHGKWEVVLPHLNPGGPFVMRIEAGNTITIRDIAVGDVWVCSGQSNMGMALGWLAHVYQGDIDSADQPFIRQFLVPMGFTLGRCDSDVGSGSWVRADPENVRSFSAVAYFFAKQLHDTCRVPIGLIHASLGGSSTEAWISEGALKAFPKYYEEAVRYARPGVLEGTTKQDDQRARAWGSALSASDEGLRDSLRQWSDPSCSTSAWDTMHVPGYWATASPGNVNGVVWFRREFIVPAAFADSTGTLLLGRIVDADSVFVNGRFIGGIGSQYAPRMYRIPERTLRAGVNTIVIRVVNFNRRGGFVPGKRYAVLFGGQEIGLEGVWRCRLGASAEPLEDRVFTGKIPTGLFSGMIAPLRPWRIKGVLWYQGESNTSRACEHFQLFSLLIRDWRTQWQQPDLPFIYVQLPNFIEVNTETTTYDWALFRESQLKALSVPGTGMAVSIDIGEGNDIHPVNKKDLGYRLALAARRVAYGETNIVSSGPTLSSVSIKRGKVILSFSNTGRGLIARGGAALRRFEICGNDGVYVPAEARIDNGTVVVWSKEVALPVAVRYAWANDPEGANLYNNEGLPASPFRTSDLY